MQLLEFLTILAVGLIKFAALLLTLHLGFRLYRLAVRYIDKTDAREIQDLKEEIELLKTQNNKQLKDN